MLEFDFKSYRVKHWYPGHMLKARNEIKQKLKLIDVVLSICDARLPISSMNPLTQDIQNKLIIHVINKSDLVNQEEITQQKKYFKENNINCLFISTYKSKSPKAMLQAIKNSFLKYRKDNNITRMLLHPIRVMIIGLPNVGKSSLINFLKNKKSSQTGASPGVTRNQQWVKLNQDIELLDTPGVMPVQSSGEEHELKLSLSNIIKQDLMGHEIICYYLLYQLHKQNKLSILSLYDIADPYPTTVEDLLERIASKRKLLLPQGKLNLKQAAKTLLLDFQKNKLGKITLDNLNQELNQNVVSLWHTKEAK